MLRSSLLVAVLALALGTTAVWAEAVSLRARTIHPAGDEGRPYAAIGTLKFRAGLVLTAEHERFGGFSGLEIDCLTGQILAVSDRGWYLSARLVLATDGTLRALTGGRLEPLLDVGGQPVEGRMRHDAEEVTRTPEGWLVSFEGEHRIAFYPNPEDTPVPTQEPSAGSAEAAPTALGEPSGVPTPFAVPAGLAEAGENQGLEAMTRLLDGRVLLITEGLRTTPETLAGWVGTAGAWERFEIVATESFRPTAAATLESGDLLLQERSYDSESGIVRMRLSTLPLAQLRQGARMETRELGRFEPPLVVDNMEALATCPNSTGGTLVYSLSDDNFNDDQRTLLYQLELPARF